MSRSADKTRNEAQAAASGAEGETVLRPRDGAFGLLFSAIAIFFAAFYLYTAGPSFFGRIGVGTYRGMFLLLAILMVFMIYPFGRKSDPRRPTPVDLALIAMTVVSFGYFVVEFDALVQRVGYYTEMDFYMALMATIVSFEATRRVMGSMLPAVAVIFLLYAVYGNLLPESVSHRGYPWGRVLTDMFTQEGMFGLVLNVTAQYVVLFVVFGALMNRFGAGDFFVRLPFALTAGYRGGPAKAAVLGSGMMGMISGSATANTVATGTFTIPLMIKAGYKRHVAGAIEPAASTGGMFMPPIMGAGVFIMAEMIQMPYTQIMIAAIVPALLYFFSVAAVAHFEAAREDIPILPKEDRESAWEIFKQGWYYLLPIFFVVYLMLTGTSPSRAVYYTVFLFLAVAIAARLIKKPADESYASVLRKSGVDLIKGLEEGAVNSLVISAVVGTVGIILGIVFLTGLGFIFTTSVMQFTFGLLPLGILLALASSYILGMGMTVTSAYILMAILVAPALEVMGVSALAAHMLVFWYSQSSNISPPVCMAAFAGASIAKANPMKTGFTALKFSAFLFVIPVLFLYTPILMPEGMTFGAAQAMVTSFIAVIAAAAALSNFMLCRTTLLERGALVTSSVILLFPQLILNLGGLLLLAGVYLVQKRRVAGNMAKA
ncbi:TRAP transporter fused permease subunit [Halovulum dunhuangense]|uniref:TRAP transporter fused permease subunit n=1 Tax=Halovulum dunhuangense TaxID=1505036 RepID=A0A849L692_9RHOB|nr:TRAP transporter fused permease subunit [Halovulum dunhuangense]NNU82028.1 TRAP transporter fused permease subunit [Halovulum dunhuangense]